MHARAFTRAVVVALCLPAAAAEPGAIEDVASVKLKVGQSVALCEVGAILCPAGAIRCDDASFFTLGGDARGPVVTGLRPGSTLCSAGWASGAGMRRAFRVTVVAKSPSS